MSSVPVLVFCVLVESMDCLSVLFKQVTKLFLERKLGMGISDDHTSDVGKARPNFLLIQSVTLLLAVRTDPTIPLLPAPPNYEQVEPHVLATGMPFTFTVSSMFGMLYACLIDL